MQARRVSAAIEKVALADPPMQALVRSGEAEIRTTMPLNPSEPPPPRPGASGARAG